MQNIGDNINPVLVFLDIILDMWTNPSDQKFMRNNIDFVVYVTSSKQMWNKCNNIDFLLRWWCIYVFPFGCCLIV